MYPLLYKGSKLGRRGEPRENFRMFLWGHLCTYLFPFTNAACHLCRSL